jgi:superfamily II DNA or RNA helicase
MAANKDTVEKQIADLKNYTDTVAAIYLFKEVAANGAVVTIGTAQTIIDKENSKKDPEIGNVVKAILAAAGSPGQSAHWKQDDGANPKWHLPVVITIGGAVYEVDFTHDKTDNEGTQEYTVKINSTLNQEVSRGKLFFDNGHSATVKLTYDKEQDLQAVTNKGLAVTSTSYKPRDFQNEILVKFYKSMEAGQRQRLAVMGTGSGKSYIMAGIAQAVGRTVMIVPDKTLVDQQAKDTRILLGSGVINKAKVDTNQIKIFTMESLKNEVDFDNPELITDHEKQEIKDYFRKVITGQEHYDQIILQAEHPWFKLIAEEIKDSMVLIDESHRHTFNEEDLQVLQRLTEKNSILALTATPTSKLYELFPGTPLDDLSLGSAIKLGQIRPIKPECDYFAENNLVDQAVLHYFDDYYLEEGMDGYIDPVQLKEQIKKNNQGIEDSAAEKLAINQALAMNRIRAQRNMAFSDDKSTREKLATIYQNIANGEKDTLEKYQDRVAQLRQKSEMSARKELAKKFVGRVDLSPTNEVPKVDLKRDIEVEQQKDIQRTINSHALALVLNEKAPDIAKKDRSHKLEDYLQDWDKEIKKFNPADPKSISPINFQKLKESIDRSRDQYKKRLKAMGEPISKLPTEQKDAIVKLVLDRAEEMVANIKLKKPISEIVTKPTPVDLVALKARENYAGAMDMKTADQTKSEQLAQMGVGLRTHIVADQVIATGISIKDVLNVQIINNYSPVIESDISAINNVLSLSQAAGRGVRESDGLSRVQQLIDTRMQKYILTVDAVIDPKESAAKTRVVMRDRDTQAKKEENAAIFIQALVRRHNNTTMFNDYRSLHNNVKELEQNLKTSEDRLADIRKNKQSLEALLNVHNKLAILRGKNVKLGQQLAANTKSGFYCSISAEEKLLLIIEARKKPPIIQVDWEITGWKADKGVIEKERTQLMEKESELQRIITVGQSKLRKLQAQEEKLEEKLGMRNSNQQ